MLKICRTTAAVFLSASVLTGGFAAAVQAKGFAVVHTFAGTPNDGDRPMAPVIFDSAGNLYGTTYSGGPSNHGTIFKIDVHGTETLLHSFDGGSGGNLPAGGLTIDEATGDLYGVTQGGGTFGDGALYTLTANGTFTVLHSFDNTHDGEFPQWRMISDKQGNLYGVAPAGGTIGNGTLFKYSKDGEFTVLHDFDSSASTPSGRLAQDKKGNLYGTDELGGTSTACFGHGCGSIYRLAVNGTFSTLYSFTDGDDGRAPVGGLTIDKKGNLYGAAGYDGSGGFGTVFVLSAKGEFATLFSFNNTNGNSPVGEVLLLNNDLYATAYTGGANNLGTVVRVSPKGVGKVLHVFSENDGGLLAGGLVESNSVLYGTASSHGADSHGTVFNLKIK